MGATSSEGANQGLKQGEKILFLNNKYTKIHAVEESDTLFCVPLVFHVQGENGPPVLSNDVVVVVETNTMKSSSEDGKGDSDSDDSPEKRRRELACVYVLNHQLPRCVVVLLRLL